MGLTSNCSKFLFYARSLGVSFEKSLMLGRLTLYAKKEDIKNQIALFKNSKGIDEVTFKDDYSEPLFEILGASKVDSLDYSNYENATIIHDLNTPIPDALKKKYTAIVDGGTIEHVFNFPIAIKNCMEALQVGGHYIGITPANNTMGHGFYQFSPELFFNVFREENGFQVKKIIIAAETRPGNFSDWYEVVDPKKANGRVMLVNSKPSYLLVLAQKVKEVSLQTVTAQQSDYATRWELMETLNKNEKPAADSRLKYLYRKVMPKPLKIFARNVYDLFTKEKVTDAGLGELNPQHYKKVTF
jgi:hypothetical protein